MSRLLDLIDAYKDAHGQPSDASIARSMGLAPQTLNTWRTRGYKVPPASSALREFARMAGLDYEHDVLRAAMLDTGWLTEEDDDGTAMNTKGS